VLIIESSVCNESENENQGCRGFIYGENPAWHLKCYTYSDQTPDECRLLCAEIYRTVCEVLCKPRNVAIISCLSAIRECANSITSSYKPSTTEIYTHLHRNDFGCIRRTNFTIFSSKRLVENIFLQTIEDVSGLSTMIAWRTLLKRMAFLTNSKSGVTSNLTPQLTEVEVCLLIQLLLQVCSISQLHI